MSRFGLEADVLGTVKESSPLEFACFSPPTQEDSRARPNHRDPADGVPTASMGSRSQRQDEAYTRIGVWVDGVVHWDDAAKLAPSYRNVIEAETGFAPLRAENISATSADRAKPNLTVTIPGSEPLNNDTTISTVIHPQRSVIAIAPFTIANAVPASVSQRQPALIPARDVSSIVPQRFNAPCDLAYPPTTYGPEDASRPVLAAGDHQIKRSRSPSSSESSTRFDDASTYSKRSSATSTDATNLTPPMKPLLPRKKQTASSCFSVVNPALAGVFDEPAPLPSAIIKTYVNKPLPPIPPMRDPRRLSPATLTKASGPPSLFRPQPSRISKSASTSRRLRGTARPTRAQKHVRQLRTQTPLDLFDAEFMRTSPYSSSSSDTASEPGTPTLSEVEHELHRHLSTISTHNEHDTDYDALNQETTDAEAIGLGIRTMFPSSVPPVAFVVRSDSVRSIMQPPSRAPSIPKKSRKRAWRHSAIPPTPVQSPTLLNRSGSDPSRASYNFSSPSGEKPAEDSGFKTRVRRSVSSTTLPKMPGFARLMESFDSPISHQPKFVIDDGLCVVQGPVIVRQRAEIAVAQQHAQAASPESAEHVLLHILASLTSLEDLASAVLINKGMYRVYKENEMDLVAKVTFNQSPPAWEQREWCSPAGHHEGDTDSEVSSHLGQDPLAYVRSYKGDLALLDEMKKVMMAECQSFIRKDTAAAISDSTHPDSQRFTDALWRIWCFCSIFGSRKGRDEDMTGQLDWLKGGRLANNLDCAATMNANFDFDANSILLNPPDHFGRGNGEGLTADQLYDVTEIWTCMAALLQGYLGRVEQARAYGVFDRCNVEEGDVDREEHMLEEWIAYVLTLGPPVVLEMAEYALDRSSAGFAMAKTKGWTSWAPPTHTPSRATFLKDPVARLYEERMAAAGPGKPPGPREHEQREQARRRIAGHAVEIRLRRHDSAFRRLPLIDMSMERPMSVAGTPTALRSASASSLFSPVAPPPAAVHPALRRPPSYHSPVSALEPPSALSTRAYSAAAVALGATVPFTPLNSTRATPSSSRAPPPPWQSQSQLQSQSQSQSQPHPQWQSHPQSQQQRVARRISPIAEEDGPNATTADRVALRAFNGAAESTAQMAVQRIVDMGFNAAQARQALRLTDMGDGLRVDRAVELLLRS